MKTHLQRLLFLIPGIGLMAGCHREPPSAYILQESELIPEGIAYAQKQNAFYLTSIAKSKIIKVDALNGNVTDFIREREHGYLPGVGILADEDRDNLYALGGNYEWPDSVTSLFVFKLSTGAFVKRFDLPGSHFLNDLIIDKSGTLYLTDTKDASVYSLAPEGTALKLFLHTDDISYPNGIVLSDDDRILYVASFDKGVRSVDVQTKEILNSPDTSGVSQGIDGLEFYQGNLLAVQNGVQKNGDNFRKLVLNESGTKVTHAIVLSSPRGGLNLPLTFCVANNSAVLIANSNLQYLDQKELRITKPDSVRKTVLKRYELDKGK